MGGSAKEDLKIKELVLDEAQDQAGFAGTHVSQQHLNNNNNNNKQQKRRRKGEAPQRVIHRLTRNRGETQKQEEALFRQTHELRVDGLAAAVSKNRRLGRRVRRGSFSSGHGNRNQSSRRNRGRDGSAHTNPPSFLCSQREMDIYSSQVATQEKRERDTTTATTTTKRERGY